METTINQTEEQRRVQDNWERTLCPEANRCPLARSKDVFMSTCANYKLGENQEACPCGGFTRSYDNRQEVNN